MNATAIRTQSFYTLLGRFRVQRGLVFGSIILAALLAFEMFNYSTTDFALTDLLGNLKFLGVRWATILAIAFCGMDFAGIARLFTPEEGTDEPKEVWYLFSAWLLAATMNAMLTWWGVSVAIFNHTSSGNAMLGRETILHIVPVFVAILVWLIRVLIIGTFTVAGDRLFSQGQRMTQPGRRSIPGRPQAEQNTLAITPTPARTFPTTSASLRQHPTNAPGSGYSKAEASYRPVAMSAPTPSNGSSRTHQ